MSYDVGKLDMELKISLNQRIEKLLSSTITYLMCSILESYKASIGIVLSLFYIQNKATVNSFNLIAERNVVLRYILKMIQRQLYRLCPSAMVDQKVSRKLTKL